jgi:transmembrane sensor
VKPRNQPLSPDQEAIEAMAAAWLAQRDEGLTAEERTEFDRWRKADVRHEAAAARLEKAWTAMQQLREFRPASRVHPDRDLLAGARPTAQIISFRIVAAATGLAAAVACGFFLWRATPGNSTSASVQPAHATSVYATTADGYQRVTLEDGSVLELNANSRARVDFLPTERRVQLVQGEAHFTVAKAPQRPFIVRAGDVAVRAVGTAFNVRIDDDEVEVLVTEGRVGVVNQAAPAAEAALPELGAGQRLVVGAKRADDPTPMQVENLTREAVEGSLAWQGPRLRFADTPLASVVAQFNRHNKIQVELGDASLMSVPVDGSFRPENVEAFIRLLESDSIRAERVGPDRIILHRAP